jgi:hypothetical protein
MARYFWNGRNAIGERFGTATGTGSEIEVVGIVQDEKFANLEDEASGFGLRASGFGLRALTVIQRDLMNPEA